MAAHPVEAGPLRMTTRPLRTIPGRTGAPPASPAPLRPPVVGPSRPRATGRRRWDHPLDL